MNKVLYFFIAAQLVWANAHVKRVQIRDLWTGKPLENAKIQVGSHSFYGDAQGFIQLRLSMNDSLITISAPNYFSETLSAQQIQKQSIVYLVPIAQTSFITVVRPRLLESPLSIPSHRSILIFTRPLNLIDLTQQLQMQSGIFLKNYGPAGSLQTISLRGMAAEQTQVLLDGIPLNNLQLGSTDLSLLAGSDLGSLEVYRGSNAILGGSGAIGGTLHLQTKMPADHLRLQLNSGWSSLRNQFATAQIDLPISRLKNVLTFHHGNGVNRYTLKQNGQSVTLKDRDFRQNFVSWKSTIPILNRLLLVIRLSHQKKVAGTPKPFTNAVGEQANQARLNIDNNLMYGTLCWQQKNNQYTLTAYVRNDWMVYHDPILKIADQPLHSLHFNQEKGLQGRFHYSPRPQLLIKSGMEYVKQFISSSEAGQHGRSRLAFYLLTDWRVFEERFSLQAFHLNSGLRLEKINAQTAVWLPSAGITLQWPLIQFYFSSGKNFRLPGFNDLYWVPGGNPHLKPEKSLNTEAGLRNRLTFGSIVVKNELALFQNVVNNQIRWLPAKSGYWLAQNIAGVKSRGVESEFSVSDVKNKLRLNFQYSYIQTLKNRPEYSNDASVGNQLPNVPREHWAFLLHWKPGPFTLNFNFQHTSFQYLDISNDPNRILPSYSVANCSFGYNFSFKQISWQPKVAIENLFNKHYSILQGYPMPGRYFSIQLYVQFNNKGGN